MKRDPYNNKEKYKKWKEKGKIPHVSSENSELILRYLTDMELGLNVARKGIIGYPRLNNLRQRLSFITRRLEELYPGKRLVDITEGEIVGFFKAMRDGEILTRRGERYISVPDYINVFKAFWHWYQRVEHKNNHRDVQDVTKYIDNSPIKEPDFVYFTLNGLKQLVQHAKYKYKILMWFIFDSGIRSPTELINIRVADLSPVKNSEIYLLDIRHEISKTFGRKIKLLLCSKLLRNYIYENGLSEDDYLFSIRPNKVNEYLKRLAGRVWGCKKTLAGQSTNELTLYDFRHSSACYWVTKYKSFPDLMYRMGWKKLDMVHYYTKFLGMRDTICEEDLIEDSEAKTKLEKDLEQKSKENEIMDEQLQSRNHEFEQLKREIRKCKERDKIIVKLVLELFSQGRKEEVVKILEKGDLADGIVSSNTPSIKLLS